MMWIKAALQHTADGHHLSMNLNDALPYHNADPKHITYHFKIKILHVSTVGINLIKSGVQLLFEINRYTDIGN